MSWNIYFVATHPKFQIHRSCCGGRGGGSGVWRCGVEVECWWYQERWGEELKTVNKEFCCIAQIMLHVVTKSQAIYAGTAEFDTFQHKTTWHIWDMQTDS